MATALAPYRVARESLGARIRTAVLGFLAARTMPLWGNAGWSIVRGTQPTSFQGTGAEVRREGWERHAVVQACIRAIAQLIAAVPIEAYRKLGDGDTETIAKHPSTDLLNAPRASLSGYELRSRLGVQFLMYGNGIWILERRASGGPPVRIRPISAEALQFAYLDTETDDIVAYDWRDLQGKVHAKEPVENVVHFRDLTAGEGLFGYPRLAAALLPLGADAEASQYVRQVVTNHGVPGMVVLTEHAASQDDLAAAEQRWHEKMTVRGQRGRTKFVAGVKDVKPIGFDLSMLEFPDLRRVSREDICAAAGVDPRIIGISSASKDAGLSGQQYREARFKLIQQTVLPVMKAIESTLDLWYMPEFGDVYARFSPDVLSELTEDETLTSARMVSEVGAKIRTVEEARETIGLPAAMKKTDSYPGGMQVGAAAENAQAMVDATLEATRNPPPLGGTNGAGDDTREAPAETITRHRGTKVLKRSTRLSGEQRAMLWGMFDTRARKSEAPYEREARIRFASEADDVRRILLESAPAEARATATDPSRADPYLAAAELLIYANYAAGGIYYEAWRERFTGIVTHSVNAGGQSVAGAVGLDFTLETPRVQAAIRRRVTKLAGNVCKTTVDSIRGAVAAARASGMGLEEAARLIEETTFGEITRSRARTIARTETVGAMNEGELLAAKLSGVVHSKEWLTQRDAKVRESHAAIDGERVDIGAAFSNGLQHPGDPSGPPEDVINCRCTLLYHDEGAPAETTVQQDGRRIDTSTVPHAGPAVRLEVHPPRTVGKRRVVLTKPDGSKWTAEIDTEQLAVADVQGVE